MKEKQIAELLQKSTLHTSEGFTDRLMQKLTSRLTDRVTFTWPRRLMLACGLSAALLAGGFTLLFSGIFEGFLRLSILTASAFCLLWLVHYLLGLKADYEQLVRPTG